MNASIPSSVLQSVRASDLMALPLLEYPPLRPTGSMLQSVID
jgi:hypothetical protein